MFPKNVTKYFGVWSYPFNCKWEIIYGFLCQHFLTPSRRDIMKATCSLCLQTAVLYKREEIYYTRSFLEGEVWGHTCGGRYLPMKCSCAICQGPEGLGGQCPDPETRESRPLQAWCQKTGWWHMKPHNPLQPITNQHHGEDEETWKETKSEQGGKSQRQWEKEKESVEKRLSWWGKKKCEDE